ncbi:conserved hypothetical protein [Azospirillaceae bacterium]
MYGPFDKQLELRGVAAAAITATTAETGIALAATMAGDFKAVFSVPALDTGTGDETYRLSVETDATAAFASPIEIGALTVTAPGVYELPLTQWQVRQHDPAAVAIRCKATLGGTTPSLTYGAFLVPS